MAHIVEELNGRRFIDLGPLSDEAVAPLADFMATVDEKVPNTTEHELLIAANAFLKGFRAGEINAGRADADNTEAEKSAPSAQKPGCRSWVQSAYEVLAALDKSVKWELDPQIKATIHDLVSGCCTETAAR